MILLAVGCSYRTTPVDVRERLAFNDDQLARALDALTTRLRLRGRHPQHLQPRRAVPGPRPRPRRQRREPLDAEAVGGFLAEFHGLADRRAPAAPVRAPATPTRCAHLFRVTASLDSLVVGEGQIAGQVKNGLRAGRKRDGTAGPLLHTLFQHARRSPSASAPRPASPGATSRSPAPRSIMSGRCSTTSATRPSSSSAPARWAS